MLTSWLPRLYHTCQAATRSTAGRFSPNNDPAHEQGNGGDYKQQLPVCLVAPAIAAPFLSYAARIIRPVDCSFCGDSFTRLGPSALPDCHIQRVKAYRIQAHRKCILIPAAANNERADKENQE
jgi:hypothetical protein